MLGWSLEGRKGKEIKRKGKKRERRKRKINAEKREKERKRGTVWYGKTKAALKINAFPFCLGD